MNKKDRVEFLEKVNYIIKTPTDELIQNHNSEQTNGILIYHEIIPAIEELKSFLSHLTFDNIKELPPRRFQILQNKLKPILDEIEKIGTIEKNPNQSDKQQKLNTIQFFNNPPNHSNGYYHKENDQIWNIILEAITLENRKLRDSSSSVKKSKELELILENAKESQEKINEALNTARTELSKGGVNKHSRIFESQAVEHETSSTNWKKNTIGLLAFNFLMIIGILTIVLFIIEDQTTRIEVGIFGALTVSLISYAVVLCTKNYFAEKHNQYVNQHRANCLGTFNTFVDAADEERKAAILLHATNTIFSHQNTGYLSKESDSNNPNPIIEVIRNVVKNKDE